MSCGYVTDIAQFIWGELGSPTDLSVSSIQSRLVSNPYLGTLNNLIVTCFSGVSGQISPEMTPDQQAIYSLLYQRDWYTTKLNQVLQGYATSFTRLQEGDSSISRSSTADVARVYRDMQKQLNDQLIFLVNSYRQNEGQPSSVLYPMLVNTFGYSYAYGGWPQSYYRS